MRRRRLLALLTAAAAVSPLGRPLGAAELARIGILDPGVGELFGAFFSGMRERGYVEDRNIVYVRRSAAGQAKATEPLARELVAARVDLLVTAGSVPVQAAMRATTKIPIVFAALGDAIDAGAVTNLARPDRNATGLSFLNTEIGSKRLELLHELLPQTRRVAILFDRNSQRLNVEIAVKAARRLKLEAMVSEVSELEDFPVGFRAAVDDGATAMNVLASPFFNANRNRLVALAAEYHLPAIYETGEYVRTGGLISYGPSLFDLFHRAAGYVDQLLKGAKPADLPVEQPTKFELTINLKAVKSFGLAVPPLLLAQADEVIE